MKALEVSDDEADPLDEDVPAPKGKVLAVAKPKRTSRQDALMAGLRKLAQNAAELEQLCRLQASDAKTDIDKIRIAFTMAGLMPAMKDNPKVPEDLMKRLRKHKFPV